MSDTFDISLSRTERFRFDVDFHDDGKTTLRMDEPEPLGDGSGPSAARVLAAAVGNCLSASLLFCLEKAHIDVGDIETHVTGTIERNERGRMRVAALDVRIEPDLGSVPPERVKRCLDIFEDFCVVTGSVRSGLEVNVEVELPTADAVGEETADTVTS